MRRDAKIIVTGASGMVGCYIARQLLREGYENVVLPIRKGKVHWIKNELPLTEIDFEDPKQLSDCFQGAECIIHSAARLFGTKEELMESNPQLTRRIVNAALDNGIQRLIHISSVACLDRWRKELTKEEHILQEKSKVTDYSYSKYLAELEVHRGRAEGLSAVILYPTQILGHFYPDNPNTRLWHRIAQQKQFYPIGSLGVIDIRDLVSAVITVLQKELDTGEFIINAENISYQELFNTFRSKIGVQPLRRALPKWLHHYGAPIFSLYYGLLRLRWNHPYSNTYLRQLAFPFSYDHSKSKEVLELTYRPLATSLSDIAAIYKAEDNMVFLED